MSGQDLPSGATALYRSILEEFERRGWRDDGATALALARRIDGGSSPGSAAKSAPSSFRAQNGATVSAIANAVEAAVRTSVQGIAATAPTPQTPAVQPDGGRTRFLPRRRKGSSATGVGILILTATIALALPDLISWEWLLFHENRFALQGAGVLVGVGLAWAAWRPADRAAQISSLIVGAVILLVSLLGGPGASN